MSLQREFTESLVGEQASRTATFVGREMETEVWSPHVATESCRDSLFAVKHKLLHDIVVLIDVNFLAGIRSPRSMRPTFMILVNE